MIEALGIDIPKPCLCRGNKVCDAGIIFRKSKLFNGSQNVQSLCNLRIIRKITKKIHNLVIGKNIVLFASNEDFLQTADCGLSVCEVIPNVYHPRGSDTTTGLDETDQSLDFFVNLTLTMTTNDGKIEDLLINHIPILIGLKPTRSQASTIACVSNHTKILYMCDAVPQYLINS